MFWRNRLAQEERWKTFQNEDEDVSHMHKSEFHESKHGGMNADCDDVTLASGYRW